MRSLFYLPLVFSLVLNHSVATEQIHQITSLRPCNGFDFPVGPPDADGFYKSRGFIPGVHLGEDWISTQGSHHSLGKPIYSIAAGKVILARDIHVAWGKVVITRHAYLEGGKVKFVDALYAHLDRIDVTEGEYVSRGQKIATMGNNHGMYPAHLHFEMHKDLRIGVNHTGFVRTLVSYWIPTDFIVKRRKLPTNAPTTPLPVTHFDIPAPWKHFFKKKSSKKKGINTHTKHALVPSAGGKKQMPTVSGK
ncbi:MAG: M23 family metallopeptidase [Chthoniobacterales bacterium]